MRGRLSIALVALLALVGCGPGGGSGGGSGGAGTLAAGLVSRLGGQGGVGLDPRFVKAAQANAPILQVGFPDRGGNGNLRLDRRDGPFEYWISGEGVHIILQQGLLHSVRGLGDGLLASDLSDSIALVLSLQPGVADRFHTFLDGEDFAVRRTFRCVISEDGAETVELPGNVSVYAQRMRESCKSLDQGFENIYWIDPDSGRIVVSRQWAGTYTGAVSTRVVP